MSFPLSNAVAKRHWRKARWPKRPEATGPLKRSDHPHKWILDEGNNVDPDDGNSWSCSACTLPIFSTPFRKISHDQTNTDDDDGGGGSSSSSKVLLLHDQCANLPPQLMDHVLHPRGPLILEQNLLPTSNTNDITCDKCQKECGSMFYQCPDTDCNFRLDLLCAVQIKILHRSHEHRLVVIRGSASFICGACGTQHDQGHLSALSYLCNICSFWLHRDCASLPNAIILHEKHGHSLSLTYNYPGDDDKDQTCALCKEVVHSLGVYFCVKCRYYAHIRCATSDSLTFEPALIREAKLAELLHFPMADEHASVMPYITGNATGGSDEAANILRKELHDHPLIFHGQNDHPRQSSSVCNACVLSISPPFYSCNQCPDFFLHRCCTNLPSEIKHPLHRQHTLSLLPTPPTYDTIPIFACQGCWRLCSGFVYGCNDCDCDFVMDIVCALMPPSITHKSHGKSHILYMSHKIDPDSNQQCNCCKTFWPGIRYVCSTCRGFTLHAKCALLPNTIGHKFDEHPLKLTTTSKKSVATTDDDDHTTYGQEVQELCEICEQGIQQKHWYYSCSQCDQSFHVDCMPSVDSLSKIKFGVTGVRVKCHNCPLTLARNDTVYGYRCGFCRSTIGYEIPYGHECCKCYFRIHNKCAKKCSVESGEGRVRKIPFLIPNELILIAESLSKFTVLL